MLEKGVNCILVAVLAHRTIDWTMSAQLNLYERLADELGTLIANKVLAPGDRLPSIRHLSQQKRLSISTVMQALRLLEDRGLIDARPQAGFYVRQRARNLPAPTDSAHHAEAK